MAVFICRQSPYGDKVINEGEIIDQYIDYHLRNKFIPIPYLHNAQVINDIGITTEMNIEQIKYQVAQTTAYSLDSNPRGLSQKKTRLKQLFENLNNITFIIPHHHQWILLKCDQFPKLQTINFVCFRVKNVHHKYLIPVNKATSYRQIDASYTLGLDILEYRIIEKPTNIRLPPVSLQQVKNPIILKIISHQFK